MTASQYALKDEEDAGPNRCGGIVLSNMWAWRKYIVLMAAPILLVPLPLIIDSSESRCAYVVLLMAVYWFTEAIPVGVTALLPVVFFPMLGIMDTNTTTMLYMKDTNMLFIGGFLMAAAIEFWGLHRRIALRILMFVGSEPKWLMLGLMSATWFLSMWISNTATTSMMIPITEAILQQLEGTLSQPENGPTFPGVGPDSKQTTLELRATPHKTETSFGGRTEEATHQKNGGSSEAHQNKAHAQNNKSDERSGSDPEFTRMSKGMSLCICYAASCGGIGSLTGTGPNLVFKDNTDALYEDSTLSNPVTFGSWMAFGIPTSLLVVVICWLWLQIAFLGKRGILCCFCGSQQDPEKSLRVKNLIRDEYLKLGPVVFGEVMLMILFTLLVTLWITRDMGGEVGWSHLFEMKVKDSVPAILVGCLLFILPSTWPCLRTYSHYSHPLKHGSASQERQLIIRPLLTWPITHEKMPWQLIFLLGGGFALSGGFNESGLSNWIADQFQLFKDWNEWAVLTIICYIAAASTEITSNTAMSSVLLPIMQRLAGTTGTHPLTYMLPVCLSTSFAFMLPVATPPNALVFSYGRVSIPDMAKAGLMMNLIAVPCVVFMTKTLGKSVFGFDDIPGNFIRNSTQMVGTVTSI